jgi:hypothetical protein
MRGYQRSHLASLAAQKGIAIRSHDWRGMISIQRAYKLHQVAYRLDTWFRSKPLAGGALVAAGVLSVYGMVFLAGF